MIRFCVHPDDDCPENHLYDEPLPGPHRRPLTRDELRQLESMILAFTAASPAAIPAIRPADTRRGSGADPETPAPANSATGGR